MIKNKLKYVFINDFGKIITGKTPKTDIKEYWGGEVPFITPTDIPSFDTRYLMRTERTISEKGVKIQKNTLLPINSICVSCIATIGKVCLTNVPSITNQQINSIIVDKKYNPTYLLYVFRYYRPYLQLIAGGTGSGTPIINKNKFSKLKYPIFDNIDIQNRIARILNNYDSLIENNNHRIKLLETMAEELYKEWFVRFRFPGYKKVKFENGIPKDWRVEKLGKYVTIKRGGSPRPIQEYLAEEGLNWLKISDVTNLISPFIFKIQEKIKQEGLNKTVFLKVGSLVLSNSATPGIPKILCVDSCIHDGWLYFENSYFSNEYLTLFFKQERTNIMKLGNGAIFTNLKTDIVKNYRVIIPKKEIIEEFQTIIQPCFDKMKVMEKQNEILIKQRDYLLPRLMSGKLSVENKNII